MKKILVVLLALVLAFSAVAALAEAKTEYNIGVLVWKFNDTYGSSVRLAMEEAAKEIGEELGVTINLNAVDANDQIATQLEQAPTIFAQNDFVIINLADVNSGEAIIDIAKDYPDVQYLFYNKPLAPETMADVLQNSIFIGTLEREAGDMQGEILADMYAADPSIDLNGDGVLQYVVFMGEPQNTEAQARTQYCVETAEACGLKMEAVTETIVANWDTQQALDGMNAVWAANKGKIEVVFCNNDDMALGVVAALNADGYNTGVEGDPEIVVIGVDATDTGLESMRQGGMTATVKQDGVAMGRANIRIAMNMLLGNDWLEGTGYEYSDESTEYKAVRIPYAKNTEVE